MSLLYELIKTDGIDSLKFECWKVLETGASRLRQLAVKSPYSVTLPLG